MPGEKNTQSQTSSLSHNRSLLSILLAHPVNGGAVSDPFASSASASTAFPFALTALTAPQSTGVEVEGAISAEKSSSRSLRAAQTKTSSAASVSVNDECEGEGEGEREGVRGRESVCGNEREGVRESQQKMFSLLPPELRALQQPSVSKNDISHTHTVSQPSTQVHTQAHTLAQTHTQREPLSQLHLLEAAAEQRFLQEQQLRTKTNIALPGPASDAHMSNGGSKSVVSHPHTQTVPRHTLAQPYHDDTQPHLTTPSLTTATSPTAVFSPPTLSHNEPLLNTHAHMHSHTSHSSLHARAQPKISDAHTYGPLFCQVFDAFQNHCRKTYINVKRHLLSLCLEHLCAVVQWARESEQRSTWIAHTLLDNDYLRPETRNGVIMILIYLFAAKKAAVLNNNNTDNQNSIEEHPFTMFCTLQDNKEGMGIASKFSIKVYNDPWQFVSLLKTLLSALIDAGALPDNERHARGVSMSSVAKERDREQGGAAKAAFLRNTEEVQAFDVIRDRLVLLLDSGRDEEVKQIVSEMSAVWERKGKKNTRSRRLSLIVTSLPHRFPHVHSQTQSQPVASFPSTTQRIDTQNDPLAQLSGAQGADLALSPPLITLPSHISDMSTTIPTNTTPTPTDISHQHHKHKRTASVSVSVGSDRDNEESVCDSLPHKRVRESELESCESVAPHFHTHSQLHTQSLVTRTSSDDAQKNVFCLHALCCVRVSAGVWEVRESVVWDVNAFFASLSQGDGELYLVDEAQFLTETERRTRRLCVTHNLRATSASLNALSAHTLAHELTHTRQCAITQWCGESERTQCQAMLSLYKESLVSSKHSHAQNTSLLQFWRDHTQGPGCSNKNCTIPSRGVFVYEEVRKVVLLVRRVSALSLSEDVWCALFADELCVQAERRENASRGANDEGCELSFGDFLSLFFPQLALLMQRTNVPFSCVLVKYLSHNLFASSPAHAHNALAQSLPALASVSAYETLGTLSSAATRILPRLATGFVVHDFVLEVL